MVRMRPIILAAVVLGLAACGREPAAEGPPPWPEHPRPDFERADWLSLNGNWEFQADGTGAGLDGSFDDRAVVPSVSGDDASGWYRREIEAPSAWKGKRVWLRFEDAGEESTVWLGGAELGRHAGAHAPFAFDVTDELAAGEASLVVHTVRGSLSQTVWLEARPATYLRGLSLIPRHRAAGWRLEARIELAGADGAARVEIASTDGSVAGTGGAATLSGGAGRFDAVLDVSEPRLWTPQTPNLYPLTVRVTGADGMTDEVQSYFGLRTAERGHLGDSSREVVLLNGKPVYLRGVEDKADVGLAESDDDLRGRIEQAKDLGFNLFHLPSEARQARRLYWADKIGVLTTCGANVEMRDNHPSCVPGDMQLPELAVETAGFRTQTTMQRGRSDSRGYVYGSKSWPAATGYAAFIDGMTPADLQGDDFVGFEGSPLIEAKPGEKLTIRPFVSHFSERTEAPALETKLRATNDLGGRVEFLGKTRKVRWQSYSVTEQEPIVMTSPDIRNYTGAVTFELKDSDGKRIAANFVNIVLRADAQSPRVEQVTPRRTALRAEPASFAAAGWNAHAVEGAKIWAAGAGRAEHRFDVPADVLAAGVTKLELLAEIATRDSESGLVRVTLAGEPMGEAQLPGDPKDEQGMLSRDGGHGYLVRLGMTPDAAFVERLQGDGALVLAFEVPKERPTGLTIHGERSGRYPMDVTLIVETERAVHRVEPPR